MKPLNPLFLLIDQLLLDDPEHYYTYQEILEAKDGKKFEHTARRDFGYLCKMLIYTSL